MKTITKRELNQQTARVLALVQDGQDVLVTERGVARWRIAAVDSATADPVVRLIAEGRITPAKANPAPWPDDEEDEQTRRYTPDEVDALFAESRGDR